MKYEIQDVTSLKLTPYHEITPFNRTDLDLLITPFGEYVHLLAKPWLRALIEQEVDWGDKLVSRTGELFTVRMSLEELKCLLNPVLSKHTHGQSI